MVLRTISVQTVSAHDRSHKTVWPASVVLRQKRGDFWCFLWWEIFSWNHLKRLQISANISLPWPIYSVFFYPLFFSALYLRGAYREARLLLLVLIGNSRFTVVPALYSGCIACRKGCHSLTSRTGNCLYSGPRESHCAIWKRPDSREYSVHETNRSIRSQRCSHGIWNDLQGLGRQYSCRNWSYHLIYRNSKRVVERWILRCRLWQDFHGRLARASCSLWLYLFFTGASCSDTVLKFFSIFVIATCSPLAVFPTEGLKAYGFDTSKTAIIDVG